ncbi:hypothetical protein SAMD00019534_036360 [Acytostelium subglobosum LB1]|uniref:hypothetical protein n=1 Tax=Acytostelium subglobosum LB1 TaxID=1410327 RepID=UPI00064496E3|nr:hypothetical protein SAMD00019534_036360 [Acytostelium subglobosum LB1]GAM20461.1 hypothetical protein SAMD00019534_036360 [Acytostelium subglobosum LB1]|eukprot:XP_012759982.1 hypothetical protein SAMD00019534_036360 [Acytostelium subglobosum LB1]
MSNTTAKSVATFRACLGADAQTAMGSLFGAATATSSSKVAARVTFTDINNKSFRSYITINHNNNSSKGCIITSSSTLLRSIAPHFGRQHHLRSFTSTSTTSSSSNNNNNNNNNDAENEQQQHKNLFDQDKVLVFEDVKEFKFKGISFIGFLQIGLLFGIYDWYFELPDPGFATTALVFGVCTGFVLATFYFIRKHGRMSIAKIFAYNKGRIIELVTYNQFGNPKVHRVVTVSKFNNVKKNASITTVEKQQQMFYLKLAGTATHYMGDLNGGTIHNPAILEKLIHTKSITQK